MDNIKIFCAGVAGMLAKKAAQRFEETYKGAVCELTVGGSNAGITKLINGEKFDVMILADHEGIEKLLMPEYTEGYYIWGGNEMVVIGNDINSDNWKEKLTAPTARIKHVNPYDDPGGYRAVMVMQLADKAEEGLSAKLLGHPLYKGLDREQYKDGFKPLGDLEDGEYRIGYKSMAVARGMNFAVLPREINLGSTAFEHIYREATFTVDGGQKVCGNAILHGITVPKNAENKEGAEAFVKMFMQSKFMMFGFTGERKTVGKFDIKIPNFWDSEAAAYRRMTMLEVAATNRQLDCLPLDREDVLLDCGCGTGRLALEAAKRVKKVICLDSSEGMLEECRKGFAEAGVTNVEFILADWQEIEIGKDVPEVDVVVQARGGGGPSSLELLKKAARKYAVNIKFSTGAMRMPEAKAKFFEGCYTEEDMAKHPELRPMKSPPMNRGGNFFYGITGPIDMTGKLPMGGHEIVEALKEEGIECNIKYLDDGWDKQFASKQEAYDWLVEFSKYPELVDMEKFRANIDKYLTENDKGYYLFLPTRTTVTWFKTRE